MDTKELIQLAGWADWIRWSRNQTSELLEHTIREDTSGDMKVGAQTNVILLEREATSLHFLIADGVYRKTSLGRATWKSLIDGSSLQLSCSEEGFDARGRYFTASRVRIGITSNNEQVCTTPDSWIGFGGGGSPHENNTCGNATDYYPDNGRRNTEAMGYILVHWHHFKTKLKKYIIPTFWREMYKWVSENW